MSVSSQVSFCIRRMKAAISTSVKSFRINPMITLFSQRVTLSNISRFGVHQGTRQGITGSPRVWVWKLLLHSSKQMWLLKNRDLALSQRLRRRGDNYGDSSLQFVSRAQLISGWRQRESLLFAFWARRGFVVQHWRSHKVLLQTHMTSWKETEYLCILNQYNQLLCGDAGCSFFLLNL